ncbi:MAG: DUF6249 domain-containing protein [Brevundimonas sp.]|uniref:DUF6249 domain-containing protein n=1 Tax=Brevundimonas sp. TaxID=1871086 RepID=UPI0027176716|nr:DUF6249 domain-containing protein [Brevundimonas sp.]MDO9587757.1 DUF6249 domain-containing protein [Brevundimonas sp.]MDP3370798.1 DUF6249 domain-containing protein [Brevundimonas sp.]MDP3656889.1 DUF6249 domain-containing protein [Brevundimonas sp.]MDZ4108776.1 DUF6249 domain-containing protein [Brevundimonas sp.]
MEDFIPLVAILSVFGSITAIIFGPTYLKFRERRETQETVRRAIDKGQDLPPEVLDALTKDVTKNLPSRTRDIRRGIIWIATGVGIAAFSLINQASWGRGNWDHEEGLVVSGGLLGVAAIPITIGLAYLILSFFNKNKD